MTTWSRALGATVILAGLLLGVPALLITWVGNPYPPGGLAEIELLSDRTVLGLLAVFAWMMWAQFAVCLVIEVRAAIVGLPARRLPVPRGQQRLVRALVHAVLAAGITVSSLSPSAAPSSAAPTSVTPTSTTDGSHTPPPPAALLDPGTTTAAHANTGSTAASPTDTGSMTNIVVERGDTLWGLAETHLGDGGRWREIATLNTGHHVAPTHTYRGPSDVLQPGWQLIIPKRMSVAGRTMDTITVQPGDTLWDLAEDTLGDPARWPRLYDVNRDVVGPDPDLILPGQQLYIPDATMSEPSSKRPATDDHPEDNPTTDDERRAHLPATPQQPQPTTTTEATTDPKPLPHVGEQDHERGANELRTALLAGGGLLAAAGVALLTAGRHRQHRWRRPGRTIAPTPDELIPVERAFIETGNVPAPHRLDRALRALAADLHFRKQPMPPVGAAVLRDGQLELRLTTPATASPPVGWTSADHPTAWITNLDDVPDEESDDSESQPPPLPALVAIGEDETGAVWFLNLEATPRTVVGGHRELAANLVRFITSELTLNEWSSGVDIVVPESATDLAAEALDPERVRVLPDGDALDQAAAAGVRAADLYPTCEELLRARLDPSGPENTDPTVLVTTDAPSLLDSEPRGRSSTLVLQLGPMEKGSTQPTINVGQDGTGSATHWSAGLRFYQLTTGDMKALGALLAQGRRTDDAPMPAAPHGAVGEGIVDVAGALLPNVVRTRNTAQSEMPERDDEAAESMLPRPDDDYIQRTATTAGDLTALAPRVPRVLADRIRQLDPALDGDLAAWSDPTSRRPRIRVLGPISVEAWGKRRQEIQGRLAVCTEVAVYLSCQERGAAPEQLAEALGVAPKSVRNRIGDTRKLLGDAPDGQPWLPEAGCGPLSKRAGVPLYELAPGVQSDIDLFRRLRLRAQAQGPDGVLDLVAALDLVTGQPFDQMRPGGYGWLSETPIHQFQTAAIVDVAHLAATSYLAAGDIAAARQCCEKAILAAPFEDRAKLDLAAVETADGNDTKNLVHELTNREQRGRTDDASDRTTHLLAQRRWRAG